MTGRELIDMIQSNCDLDREIFVQDDNGRICTIVDAENITLRDPYDGDFDTPASAIKLFRTVRLTNED